MKIWIGKNIKSIYLKGGKNPYTIYVPYYEIRKGVLYSIFDRNFWMLPNFFLEFFILGAFMNHKYKICIKVSFQFAHNLTVTEVIMHHYKIDFHSCTRL
jgi:hypothetical protein